jgi:FkbM family methyltransferase
VVDFAVGDIIIPDGKEHVSAPKGKPAFALFGPYTELGPGKYKIMFQIAISPEAQCPRDALCCYIEVTENFGGIVIASRPIFASSLGPAPVPQVLNFEIAEKKTLEFRAYTTGLAGLVIDADRPIRPLAKLRVSFYPILESASAPLDDFFADNFEHFRELHERGATVSPTADGAIVDLFGVRLRVRNFDDFQLINEIMFGNIYNFHTRRPACVIDIGMNVGVASLYFARMPHVLSVHSFEPFTAPFARAIENFTLNPDIRAKITPHLCGLGDAEGQHVVLCDPQHTIATSVRGAERGKKETILIRDAAGEFLSISEEATKDGLDIVVKMDCEGSEFSIIETLDRADLLGRPQIFMIEWHKGWSPDKTQHDIIRPLARNGFDIFDRTNPLDPYAGELYAVRGRAS